MPFAFSVYAVDDSTRSRCCAGRRIGGLAPQPAVGTVVNSIARYLDIAIMTASWSGEAQVVGQTSGLHHLGDSDEVHPDPSGAGNCHCQPGTLMPILGFLMFDAAIARDDK